MNVELPMLGSQNNSYSQTRWTHTIGARTYEISNHLGNVLSVISDKPIPHDGGGAVDYYLADLRSSQDYSPFGVTLKERASTLAGTEDYRYSFQGQEHDDEIKGKGNSVNFKYRMHDPRLVRFFVVDPLTNTYPYLSPYHFSHNSPIYMIEIEGLEGTIYVYKIWTDNSGYHISSEPIDSYVVEGLKSNVNKALIMPYGEPNGKAVQIKYSSAAPNGGSLTVDANNKPSVKELNEFFGDKMPSKEKTSKSFGQKFNDMAPIWARDGAREGGAECTNVNSKTSGVKGMYNTADNIDYVGDKISYIPTPFTKAFGAIISMEADILRTIADYNTLDAKDANANLGIRISTSVVGKIMGGIINKNSSGSKKYIEEQVVRKTLDKVEDSNTKKP